jgi:hypothetical protein
MKLLRILSVASADPPPSPTSQEWAQGPYSAMHMLLEKTIFDFDVLTVDVRVGGQVHDQATRARARAGGLRGYQGARVRTR